MNRNWIALALILAPIMKQARFTEALAVAGFLYWGWGDVAVIPVVMFALTHLPEWSAQSKANSDARRQQRERNRQQRMRERHQEEFLNQKSRTEAIERARIAALPPPRQRTKADDLNDLIAAMNVELSMVDSLGEPEDEKELIREMIREKYAEQKLRLFA